MAVISITNFKGLVQKTEATKLSPEFATHCVNCLFEAGTITSMRGISGKVANPPEQFSGREDHVFYYEGTWGRLPKGGSFAESPVVNDYLRRFYVTSPSLFPRTGQKDFIPGYRLGVPYPVDPPIVGSSQRLFFADFIIDPVAGSVFMETSEPHGLREGMQVLTGDRSNGADPTNRLYGFMELTVSLVNGTRVELVTASRELRTWRDTMRDGGPFEVGMSRVEGLATKIMWTRSDLSALNSFSDRTFINIRQSNVTRFSAALNAAVSEFESVRLRLNVDYDWAASGSHDVSSLDLSPLTALRAQVNIIYAAMGGNAVLRGTQEVKAVGLHTVVNASELDKKTVSYIYTYVNEWGDESAPSLPSPSIDVHEGVIIGIKVKPTQAGNWNWEGRTRIYRSASGSSTAEFLFVKEIINNTGSEVETFYDFNSDEFLAEAIETIGWHVPPQGVAPELEQDYQTGPLQGIINTPTGFMAGFTGRTLCFSVPYAPYAWPVVYQDAVPHDVVKLVAFEGAILVLTKGDPYLMFGTDPKSLVLRRINKHQACLNAESVVDMGDHVIYASTDGLVGIENGQGVIVTTPLFSREQWQLLNPTSIIGSYMKGTYLGLGIKHSGECYAFTLDYRSGEPIFTFVDYGCVVNGFSTQHNPQTDETVLVDMQGVYIVGEGAAIPFLWRSKVFDIDAPRNYGYLQVKGSGYPFTVRVFTDQQEHYVVQVPSPEPMRLPSGIMYREWQLEISGTGHVRQIAIAQHTTELP